MKVLLINLICFLFISSSLSYSSSVENEPSISQNGLFGYFGNLWKGSFWNKGNATTKPAYVPMFSRIHRVSRPTTTHAQVKPSTLDEPSGIFGHIKSWVNVIKEKIPLNMHTIITTKFLEPNSRKSARVITRTTSLVESIETSEAKTRTEVDQVNVRFANHSSASLNHSLRSAHTFTPLTGTVAVGDAEVINPISSVDTVENETAEESISESTTTAQVTFTTLPTTIDTYSIESIAENTTNSNFNENTPESTIEIISNLNLNRTSQSVVENVLDSISNSIAFQSTIEITKKTTWYFHMFRDIRTFDPKVIKAYFLKKNDPEKFISTSTEGSSTASVITSDNDTVFQTTKKKRYNANANKLTPYYFTFIRGDDFAINIPRREYRLPSTLLNIHSRRTRKHNKTSRRGRQSKSSKYRDFITRSTEGIRNIFV